MMSVPRPSRRNKISLFVFFQTRLIPFCSPFDSPHPHAVYVWHLYLFHSSFGAAAYALSSNYNFEPGFGSGFDPIQAAVAKVDAEGSPYSELERDLIHAMTTRSSAESKAAVDPSKFMFGELKRGLCVGVSLMG